MIRTKRWIVATGAVSAAALLLSACSSGSGSKSTSGSSTGTGATSSAVVAPPAPDQPASDGMATTGRSGVKTGGHLNWGISQTVSNFNYNEVDGPEVDAYNIDTALLPAVYHFDNAGTPSVDTDYFTAVTQTSASPLTIHYKINPKAKWSNGTPITWQDFKWQALALNGKNAAYKVASTTGYDQIKSVTMGANAEEAVVTYATPFADWKSLFAPLYPASVNKTAAAFNTSWAAKPLLSAGPFKYASQDKTAQSYTIVRDPKWWGAPAKLDSITFKAYSDTATAVQAIGSKQVDYYDISGGTAFQNIQALKKFPNATVRQAAGVNYRQFTLNTQDATLKDIKVRQAVLLGLDRNRMTKLLIGNLGGNPTSLNNHFFMKNQTGYESTCGNLCNYNPGQAQSLLKSDGWKMSGGYFQKNGKTLSLAITIPADTPNSTAEAETAQATLRAAGIKLTLSTVPTNDFFAKYINVQKFQLTTFTWIGTQFPVGGSIGIYRYDPKNLSENYGLGGNTAINAILNKAISSPSTAQEYALTNKADAQLWQNAAWFPLYQRPQVFGVTKTIVNLGALGLGDYRWADIGFKV